MKKNKRKFRNIFVILAKSKNTSGPMRDKRSKRKNGKNKQKQFLDDDY